mgnify:CR=1 FL=1
MRLKSNKTSKGSCYYIIRSVYKNGKNTSEIVEKLGYPEEIKDKYDCEDPIQWMDDYLKKLNEIEEVEKSDRGTDVILYIDDDCKEFLEKYKAVPGKEFGKASVRHRRRRRKSY